MLFCDLVGSTELAARLDPEDTGEVIRSYQERCGEVVSRWDGHVAEYMGDGVLAYFGWPQAHEDDAERAVRAGLDLAREVGQLTTTDGAPLGARVGIATGFVMVGDLVGEGTAQEQRVIGETPNLAARLQALAKPGSVVISQATRRLVGGLFQLADLGPQWLRGFAGPLPVWRVAGEGQAEDRFEALHGEHLTPLVGREHELGILLERWAWAKAGDGQVVLIGGEPGIGKSRMIRALRERLGDEPHTALSHYCSPHHINSALYPVIDQLERATRLERDAPPEAQLARIEALLGRASDQLDEAVPLLAALLGAPTGDRDPALTMTPEVQKRRTLQTLVDQLAGLAARQPVLALYEDVHWIDPSTLELLDLVIELVRRLPVLVLITFRPEPQPKKMHLAGVALEDELRSWTSQPHVTTLTLSRLGRRQGADLVARVTGDKRLPVEVVEQIVAKTDGVPLFVEELTKTVLESGLLTDAGNHYQLSGPVPPLAIPTTLRDSLMARLDRLSQVKEVAQIAAVIGREFSHELLAAVADASEADLEAALDQLVASELVFRRGAPPKATYAFKHALVQDAAYQSLLKSKRQQLHTRIVQAFEQQFPDPTEAGPEILARHLTDAGLAEKAIPYWRRAGELAAKRSANLEAITHLSKGLELILRLPNAAEHLDEELRLRLAIGSPLMTTKGYSSLEVERNYDRAMALCEQLGRSAELFPVLRGLWHCYLVRGELKRAYDLAEQLVMLAEQDGAPLSRALARRAQGSTLFYLGEFAAAEAALNKGIAIDDAIGGWDEPAHLLLYPERAGVVCRLFLAWALWYLGFADRALETMEAAHRLGLQLPHASGLALVLDCRAVLHSLRCEFAAARRWAKEVIEIAKKYGLSQRLAEGTICLGFALVGRGQESEGVALLRDGMAAWRKTGAGLFETQWLGFTAQAHLRIGQPEEALATVVRAAETAATSECHYKAELHRLRGTALAKTGKQDEAAACLLHAIDTARSQRAKSLELRAATSLARLWRDQGKRAQAHDLLAPIYGWFTEGFETADLKDAKALLDELA